jgi:hypothetical protein
MSSITFSRYYKQGGCMKTSELLRLIEEKFEAALAVKTGWGRNEVMAAYRRAVAEALAEAMD